MKLINLIVNIFNIRWGDKIFINSIFEHNTFASFINEVFNYCTIITEVQNIYGQNVKFALWATNHSSYVACFIALILKNVDFYLIPPNMSSINVKSIIANSDINFLFTSFRTIDIEVVLTKIKTFPFFKGVYDIFIEEFTYIKTDTHPDYSNFIDTIKIKNEIETIKNSTYCPEEIREAFFKGYKINRRNRIIGIFSSGSDTLYPHVIYFDDETIYNGLMKLYDSNLLPNISSKSVYSKVNFSDAPIWSILWPLHSGAYFVFSLQEAQICIENNNTFEQCWQDTSKNIYEIRWIGKQLLKSHFFWLLKLIIRHKLKTYFNFGVKKDAIIILNAFLAPNILKTIVSHLPIYTTYGMQECNQILAINNFSTKQHCKDNCVGEALDGVGISIKETNIQSGEGSLVINSNHLSNLLSVEKGVYYDTRDHASLEQLSVNKVLIYIYGKAKYAIKNSMYSGSNYENLERILKNVPYFKNVMLFSLNNELHVIVYPNSEIAELGCFELLDFKNFIKVYKTILNDKYGEDFIKDIKINFSDFIKTHDGKIKKIVYEMYTMTEIDPDTDFDVINS
jgi:hypothetical protein